MSLFDDASLAMIPSAYKDGKLYSIKPSDGSGDFTFSRGSNLAATRVDVNGLIEKGRENLLLQSNQFDTTWTKSSSITLTSGQSGYDGSSDAWLLESDGSAGVDSVFQSVSSSGVNTCSIYAKAGTNSIFLLRVAGLDARATFDLSTISVSTNSQVIDASIEQVGTTDWYRCSMYFNGTANLVLVYPNNLSAPIVGSIYIQDAQLELGLVATDYIETTTTTAQAGILEDMPRLDYSGGASCPSLKLEPQRSNIIIQSEYFGASDWIKSDVTLDFGYESPDGTNSAYKVTDSGANAHIAGLYGGAIVAGVYKSIWAKTTSGTGKVNLLNVASDTNALFDITNEWQRFDITHNGANFFYAVDFRAAGTTLSEVLLWGAQAEVGSYPTSYIPTYGTSQTRSADNHQLNITSIIESSSFTWFFDLGDWVGSAGNSGTYELINTGSTRIQLRVRSDGYRMYYQNTNGGSSYPVAGSQTANKFCIAYDGLNYRLFIDGTLVNTYPSVGDTNWSFLMNIAGGGVNETLIIKQEVLFPTPLTDSECIALTTL